MSMPCDIKRAEIHTGASSAAAKFSVLIPTWNNLEFVRLCVAALRRHSAFVHQIILHINNGADGTLDWARREKLAYTHTPTNVGICHAVNLARTLAHTDYIVYMNDDMVVCPGWDAALWEEIEALGHPFFFLSATMLEPYPTHSAPVIAPRNYGVTVDTFDEARLLREFASPQRADWSGATRPPNIVHKTLWDLVGGYSSEFSPGSYSDPDFSMKLWQAGIRHFRGIGRSRVYHFVSKTIARVPMNRGRAQFLRKWGIRPSTLETHLLRLGEPFTGDLPDVPVDPAYRRAMLKNKILTLLQR
jgi:GT2 family glycosyltransferase